MTALAWTAAAAAAVVLGLAWMGADDDRPSSSTTWAELQRSSTARRLGLDNAAPAILRPQLARTARLVVDPLRRHLGDDLVVTSAYRSPAVNAAVGGHRTSFHVSGRAVDLVWRGHSSAELAELAESIGIPGQHVAEPGHLHVELP